MHPLERRNLINGLRLAAKHPFWDTQPVPKFMQPHKEVGPINKSQDISKIEKEGSKLPDGFEWCSLDLTNEAELSHVHDLLHENYVEDKDMSFRFDYTKEFIKWALLQPNYNKNWHVGIRSIKSGKVLGMVTGTPITLMIEGK